MTKSKSKNTPPAPTSEITIFRKVGLLDKGKGLARAMLYFPMFDGQPLTAGQPTRKGALDYGQEELRRRQYAAPKWLHRHLPDLGIDSYQIEGTEFSVTLNPRCDIGAGRFTVWRGEGFLKNSRSLEEAKSDCIRLHQNFIANFQAAEGVGLSRE